MVVISRCNKTQTYISMKLVTLNTKIYTSVTVNHIKIKSNFLNEFVKHIPYESPLLDEVRTNKQTRVFQK